MSDSTFYTGIGMISFQYMSVTFTITLCSVLTWQHLSSILVSSPWSHYTSLCLWSLYISSHKDKILNCKCTIVLILAPPTPHPCSMLPLFLKDGLLVPYIVTSLAFLYFGPYLLSALEHSSEEELRLGAYHKLLFFLPKMDLASLVRRKVSV